MKKLFTLGLIASSIAVSIVACTKNNNSTPTPNRNNITTYIKVKDTVTPPHANIWIKDTVTPPRTLNALTTPIKRDTVTPPHMHLNIAVKDTVTPPLR